MLLFRCGIEQAVESLQESGNTAQGAVIIIISQGSISSFSLGKDFTSFSTIGWAPSI